MRKKKRPPASSETDFRNETMAEKVGESQRQEYHSTHVRRYMLLHRVKYIQKRERETVHFNKAINDEKRSSTEFPHRQLTYRTVEKEKKGGEGGVFANKSVA